ncbi:MAG: class I SAM-dependent methyltransferase [Pseudomonadota bacterium]
MKNICPLCQKVQSHFYHSDKKRTYWQCQHCQLVYVPSEFQLSLENEKKQYDFHINNPDDAHYRKFLSRLFEPLCEHLSTPASGLDFGSGPGPTLSIMFEEAGYHMAVFDKFYATDSSVFNKQYDFITATEVFEHLSNPAEVIKRLLSIIKPQGYLGLMTKMVINKEQFSHWHYKNDLTHISFFSQQTFNWLAEEYNLKLEFVSNDVIILQKTSIAAAEPS